MMRALILLALLAPAVAHADPITIITLAVTATLQAAVAFVVVAALQIGRSAYQRRKARKQAAAAKARYNASLSDRTITALTADPPVRTVYGDVIVGGDIYALPTSDKTSQQNGGGTVVKADGLRHIVLALASHQVEAIGEVYIDGTPIGTLDANGWATNGEFADGGQLVDQAVTFTTTTTFASPIDSVINAFETAPGEGGYVAATVTLSPDKLTLTGPTGVQVTCNYRVASGATGKVRVEKFLGTASQTASSYLTTVAPSEWTSDHRLRGIAYIIVTLDLEETRFQGGPPGITARVQGKRLYDPRKDSTNGGSGSHRDNNPATWEYSTNMALIARDYLRSADGFAVEADDIDDTYTITAANACAMAVDITVGGVTTSLQRYVGGALVLSTEQKEVVLASMEDAMAGQIVYGGRWFIMPGVWTAPVSLPGGGGLTDADLDGDITIVQAGEGSDELFNGVRGQYVPLGKAAPTDFEPYQNATFVTADGRELWTDQQFAWTQNPGRCRNIARIRTEQSRSGLVIQYPAKLRAWPAQVGDRLQVTSAEYAWAAKTFRVTDWNWGVTSPVLLTLQEDAASIYDTVDATAADPTPNTGLASPWVVDAPTGVAAASGDAWLLTLADGTVVPRVRVTWDAITTPYTDRGIVRCLWKRPGDTGYRKEEVNVTDKRQMFLIGAAEGEPIVIRLLVVNNLGAKSPEVIIGHTVGSKTNAPDNVSGLTAQVDGLRVTFKWSESAVRDYKTTEARRGTWASPNETLRGGPRSLIWTAPSAQNWTFRFRHQNKAGVYSASDTTISVTTSDSAAGLQRVRPLFLVFDGEIDPADAVASFTVRRDGRITGSGSLAPADDNWFEPTTTGVGDDYEVRVTQLSGNAPSGPTLGTWVALTSDRTWTNTQTTVGSFISDYLVEVRKVGTTAIGSSGTVRLSLLVGV